jgi:hypothetical protein
LLYFLIPISTTKYGKIHIFIPMLAGQYTLILYVVGGDDDCTTRRYVENGSLSL